MNLFLPGGRMQAQVKVYNLFTVFTRIHAIKQSKTSGKNHSPRRSENSKTQQTTKQGRIINQTDQSKTNNGCADCETALIPHAAVCVSP